MFKLHKLKLYPTKKQAKSILAQLEVHRELYNTCLRAKIDAWENEKKNLSAFKLMSLFVSGKHKGKANSASLQQTVRRVDESFGNFFRGGGYPRFKSKNRFRTIRYSFHTNGWKILKDKIYLQHVGRMSFRGQLPIGKIKSAVLTKVGNEFFIHVFTEYERLHQVTRDREVGIDFGIKSTITTSDGLSISTPTFRKDKQKEIARLSRSKNYKALGKVHKKITNKRSDFNHKLSRSLVNTYDVFCLEDLQVKNIISDWSAVNSRIHDVAIDQLKNYIKYKAENAGKIVVMVDPAYTTQDCCKCGARQKLRLTQRTYSCECGHVENRDINAAKNILARGLASLGLLPQKDPSQGETGNSHVQLALFKVSNNVTR